MHLVLFLRLLPEQRAGDPVFTVFGYFVMLYRPLQYWTTLGAQSCTGSKKSHC